MRRKQLRIVFIILILSWFSPYRTFAAQAKVLSDAELDNISAAGFDIDINSVSAFRSSVAAQSNIAALKGFGLNAASLSNSNFAIINNIGNSAVAAQSNIAAIVADRGNIEGVTVNNRNVAEINNMGNAGGYAEAGSLNANIPSYGLLGVNNVYSDGSALASQSNIAALIALDGNIKDTLINNHNDATLANFGNSAVAAQSNIAIIVAQGNIDNTTINNSNVANVVNTLNGSSGGANIQNFTYSGLWGNLNIQHISVNYSTLANQRNIAVVVSLSGNVKNISVNNSNIANAQNILP